MIDKNRNSADTANIMGYDFAYITVSTGGCFNQFPTLIGKL